MYIRIIPLKWFSAPAQRASVQSRKKNSARDGTTGSGRASGFPLTGRQCREGEEELLWREHHRCERDNAWMGERWSLYARGDWASGVEESYKLVVRSEVRGGVFG